jgi:metal-sulfur cluster biosynthetic enzyme
MSSEDVDLKEVQRQLSKVIDPEIGVPIVEMNLIDKLDIQNGNVDIAYHATTPYCPPIFALKISQDMKSCVEQVKNVKSVKVTVSGHYLSDAVNRQVNKPAPAAAAAAPQPEQEQQQPQSPQPPK